MDDSRIERYDGRPQGWCGQRPRRVYMIFLTALAWIM